MNMKRHFYSSAPFFEKESDMKKLEFSHWHFFCYSAPIGLQ